MNPLHRISNIFLTTLSAGWLAFGPHEAAHAAAINKAAAGTDLTAGASWSGGTAPGSGDVATWVSGSLGGTSLTLGSTASSTTAWQGIDIQAATAALTINGGAAGQTLSIGSSGISIASGGQNLTFGSTQTATVEVNGNQTWTIGTSRRLLLGTPNLSVKSSVTAGGWSIMNNNSGTGASSGLNITAASGTFDFTKAVISGAGSLFANDNSGGNVTIKLGDNNSFTGQTELRGATKNVQFTKLAAGGANSSFGAGTGNLVVLGTASAAILGTLENTGAGGSTARPISVLAGATGLSLLNSGSGDIAFNDTTTAISMTAGTVTLGGANGNNTFAQAIGGAGAGGTSLAKSGNSTWKITGTHTYAGGTSIGGGTLNVAGGSLANTAITVTSGTFGVQPGSATTINLGDTATSAGATLNLGGNTFDMTDGAVSTCNLQQGATFGSAALTLASGATLKFNVANSSADLLAVTKSASAGGTINITLNTSLMTGPVTTGTYNLITAASGLTAGGASWQFTGGGTTQTVTVGGTPYRLTLNASDTAISVTVANLYTVTYVGNGNDGGTAPTDSSSPYVSGSTVTVLGAGSLTKFGGYTFNGWNTAANGSGTAYAASATFTISADTTLYAQWVLASATITAPGTFPGAASTTYGTASSAQSVAVSGSGLSADITATAPTGFEVSSDGSTYGATATFTQSGGSASGTLYVRLKSNATVSGSYDSQNVSLTSPGATPVNVATAASGNTVTPKALNIVSATAQDRLHDGTTAATVTGALDSAEAFGSGTSSDGKPYTGDALTVYCTGSTFASSAVGTGISVTAGTFSVSGAAAGNYTVAQPSLSLSASILDTAVWTSTSASAVWGTAANWLNNIVGTNTGNTANFNQVDITSDTTLNLTTPLTIGNLIFGDTDTGSVAGWTLTNSGVSANVLTLAGASPTVTINNLGTGKQLTISTVVAGSDGLTKQGSGTLNLSAANTFSGPITIGAGTMSIGGAGQLGGGTYAGSITNNGTLQYSSWVAQTFSGAISGTGVLAISGSGAVTLGASNNYSGGTVYSGGGVLTAVTNGALGLGALTMNTGAARLSIAEGVTLVNAITINAASPGTGNAAINGTGTGTTTLAGPINIAGGSSHIGNPNGGTVIIAGAITSSVPVNLRRGNLVLSGGGSYTSLLLNQDTLQLGANNGISPEATVFLTSISSRNGTLHLNGFDQELAGLQGPGTSSTATTINTNAIFSTLTLNTAAASTYSGTIASNITLVKIGTSTQTLAGANSYVGNTIISAGTLSLSGGGSIASSPSISVDSGATLDVSAASFMLGAAQTLRGNGTVNGAAIINGTVAPGTSSIGMLTFGSPPTLAGNTLMKIDRNAGSPLADKIAGGASLGGTLTVTNIGAVAQDGDTFDLFDGAISGGFANLVLPAGGPAHWRTNNLVVNGTITFSNMAPLARAVGTTVPQGGVTVIPFNLGKYSLATDVDADVITITSLNNPNLGTAGTDGSSITYTNLNGAAGATDSFDFTVSDGFGGTSSATVTVRLTSATGANLLAATAGDGFAYLTYAGIPGTNYVLDWATDAYQGSWIPVRTNQADGVGQIRFTNLLSSYPTNDFFRTRSLP